MHQDFRYGMEYEVVVHQESEQALLKSSQFYFEEIDCAVKVLRPVIMYTVKF